MMIELFSVIIPIHEAFIEHKFIANNNNFSFKSSSKRRSKTEIKASILNILSTVNISANELYKQLGYSGNASKTFRKSIDELIAEGRIHYASANIKDANNVLIKN